MNTLEYAKIFQSNLDKIAVQESVTGWMDANASQVIYNGGDEIKIPVLKTDGLADYSRSEGYADGSVEFRYQTHRIRFDRGRRLDIDAMDVDETNFGATAGNIMATFQREHVIPEVDAVRISTMAQKAKLTQELSDDPLKDFKKAVVQIRDKGYSGQLIAHVTYNFLSDLELRFAGQLRDITFSINGVDTTLPSIDGVALVATTSDKMVSEVNLTDNGWEGAGDKLAFVIAPITGVLGINKQDVPRIFEPSDNQRKDAWIVAYRRYYDAIIPESSEELICVGKEVAGE